MKHLFLTFCSALAALLLAACEKPYVGVESEPAEAPNVTYRITSFEQVAFDVPQSRAMTDITQLCSRINLVVYDGETKVKSIAQKAADKDFGTLALTLPEGTYTVAIIAHSTGASATVTSLDKISFDHNVISDTFLFTEQLTVGSEAQNHDVQMRRVAAMFRVNLTEALPGSVAQLKFYYTGGSSTLSAITGYGSVNSKQTVVLDVGQGQKTFEVYTFPHEETDVLKVTVTALDAAETPLAECVLEDVPVTRNKITVFNGNLFSEPPAETSASSYRMRAESDWDGVQEYTR